MTTLACNWPTEFAKVISCTTCTTLDCRKLLRDQHENIPQPGYVGSRYGESRLLLVGQNPGVGTGARVAGDRAYTASLREVARNPSPTAYRSLSAVMENFVPSWPVHGNYFPLRECGMTLQHIAYCNVVRCRTTGNAAPSRRLAYNCVDTHFRRWLELLTPSVVVFIGKWAFEHCRALTDERKIPSAFMNRQRSLSGFERDRNRREVVEMVKANIGGSVPNQQIARCYACP